MGLSILKITGTGSFLRSIFRSLNSYRGARMVSTANRSAESQVSSSSDSPFSSSSSSSSPLLMLSPRSYNTCYDLYNIAENRLFTIPKSEKSTFRYATKIVGSSHGWLACFNYRRNELFLSNPLSGRRVNLPPVDNLSIPRSSLRSGVGIQKIIISCSDPESEECRAMMLFNTSSKLAYCCPGISSSTEWTTIKETNEDFVYCATQELLFTVHLSDKSVAILVLEAWDLRNPLSPSLVWSCDFDKLEYCYRSGGPSNPVQNFEFSLDQQEYLVVSQKGELFLVFRCIERYVGPDGLRAKVDPEDHLFRFKYPPKTADYKVHKIVREGDHGGKKIYMHNHLDDQVMFIGWLSHGIAVPATDANGFQPNTICFTDDAYTLKRPARGTDNGIFDYKNKTFHPCYYPFDFINLRKKIMPPLWLTPN
ncbi:hypothetical protein CASFOL_036664 [Castilleja foliolosa]|uniref:KIB1-4 beta-propeller domain-containing protein n=1 Tax=Castilleja foliolosa TaxID=1961234 RepID=A0ABD3BP94_9LAMI